MATYGLSNTGFLPKDLETIKDEIEDTWRQKFGQNVEVEPESPDGAIIGTMADRESDIWDQIERVYSAAYLDGAGGVALDDLVSMTATVREPATFSAVSLLLGGTPGTVVPAGSAAEDSSTGRLWITLADSAPFDGLGFATVTARAENTGPVAALAGTIDTINTPVSGWGTVTNPADATLGDTQQTDASLRATFRQTFRGGGGSSADAIRAVVLRVSGVTQCIVVNNRSPEEDEDGRPPHSFEVIVSGGANQDILDAIWSSAPAGIEFVGSQFGTVTDANGDPQTVRFSRFASIPIHILVQYTAAANASSDIESLILAEILEHASSLRGGDDVVPFQFQQAIETPGVLTMNFNVGLATLPTSEAILEIAKTEQADFDSSRILFEKQN